jgi:hypothetical protein
VKKFKQIVFLLTAAADGVASIAWTAYGLGFIAEIPHIGAGIEAGAFFCAALFMFDGVFPSPTTEE